ncbi:MAG: glutamate--tRNA ligase [Pseudomonadota bacterium]
MTNTKPRVRFAPSPTGTLHIGGARTALFNWLFARHTGGAFILRIEDTDLERSTQEHTESILAGMQWLGMDWDEGPFFQTKRFDLYQEQAKKLLKTGNAYKCYCTPEEVEAGRQELAGKGLKPKYNGKCRNRTDSPDLPFTLRLKAPLDGKTVVDDICRGRIEFDNQELDDLIIARSDGTPTYNFTVVVDDVTMNITHVIRGDDHINNTPRQVLIYEALGYAIPTFAHLPMIFGPDKKKLSKRHGATSVTEYQNMGFLSEAMLNYLARLGWAYKDQEIFSVKELIEKFDLNSVGKAASVFDIEKLNWVNSQHLLNYSKEELVDLTKPYLEKLDIQITDKEYAAKAIESVRVRGKTLVELAQKSAFYFRSEVIFEEKAKDQWLTDECKANLKIIRESFANMKDFSESNLEQEFKKIIEQTGQKMKNLAQPVRVALTGTTESPGIHEILSILGKQRVLQRLDQALNYTN